jgi:hypothetical protein
MLQDSHPRSSRGVSGDDPEGGAGSGVLRRRLVTVRLGRLGTPPSRHYDLGARSSLHGSARHLPAVVGRRAPKETEARPREPKTATVERREASVPRHKLWDARRLARRLACRVMCRPHGCSAEHPNVSRRSAHPSFGVSEATMQNPGRPNAPREREWLFDIVRRELPKTVRRRAASSAVLMLRSAHAQALPQSRVSVRASRRMRTAGPHASRRTAADLGHESACARVPLRCSSA